MIKKKRSHIPHCDNVTWCVYLYNGVSKVFFLVLYIVSARVCVVGGVDVCLGIMHGWCIHVPIGNWIVLVFHDILSVGNACHWNLMILILLCIGWDHGQWNFWWWLVLAPLGSGPILQGWFVGVWRFFSHSKVLLFLIHIQITWHVWLFQRELRWRHCENLVGFSWWGTCMQRLGFFHHAQRGRIH